MSLYTFNPLEDPRWAAFVRSHPRASVFHTPSWLEAVRRTYGYEPLVCTTSHPTASLTNGIVFCGIDSWLTGRRLVSLPFADHCEPLVEAPEDRQQIFAALTPLVERERWKYVEIRPVRSDFLGEPGLARGSLFCLHVLDLRPALKDLFQGLHKNAIQAMIRRAEREGLCYEEGRSEALLDQFYRLLLMTRRRHKLPPQPIEWFRNLIACFGEQLKIRVASKGCRAVASILTLRHEDTIVHKYGGSDAAAHNLGATPFLLWKTIEEAKDAGVQKLDLGRSDLNNSGLINFKERWGATRSTLTYLRCAAPSVRTAERGYRIQMAQQVFARMPDGLLTIAGKLLYRHIG